jgi:hypothetical protein
MMSLISLANRYNAAATPEIQALGDAVLSGWNWTTLIYMIVFSINAVLFYYLVFRSEILPRFIAVWGLFGALMALVPPISAMFGMSLGMILYAPIGLNELFLAIWLIFSGFREEKVQL